MSYSTVKSKDDITIGKIGSNIDKTLANNINKLLPQKHNVTAFVGTSGSGKTNTLISLLTAKRKNGVRNSYKKVYDKIIIVSPTLSSLKNNIFEGLPDEQKYDVLDENTIDSISDFIEEHDDLNKLIIFDDVGSQLKNYDRELGLLVQKYRHDRATYWFVSQKFKDLNPKIRLQLTHLFFFRPVNNWESQSIADEILPISRKELPEFIDFVFDKKYQFLYVDMSLQNSNKFLFYKGFEKIVFPTDKE
tara:strand:+ start:1884 stop:2624 length:741 start_codon:yes stop_codon:yes gene_type:complete